MKIVRSFFLPKCLVVSNILCTFVVTKNTKHLLHSNQ
nr:MAG TPA: hypothetical protein [Caudoviricetes sp.]